MKHILEYFASLKADESWTYADLTPKDTTYLTHSYHRYPAKFIPQLVRRIINEYSNEEELVCDPFVGCGTTLLEGLLVQRYTIGLDVNPVAYLISKTKTTPIQPERLQKALKNFFTKLNIQKNNSNDCITAQIERTPSYGKIKFWFHQETTCFTQLI